jgi:hypothetical protein
VLFVAGLVVAIVARGGWRQWRNLALFAGVALAVALPWHLAHLSDFSKQVDEAASANNAYPKPDWDLERFTWYGWNVMNLQLWLPLTVLFVAGAVAAVARFARTRRADDPTPELVVGGVVSFLAVAVSFHFHNPRYTLPALVYLAVLGTGWVAFAGRRLRIAAVAAVIGLFAINNAGVDFAPWGPVVIGRRGPLVVERSATVVSNFGLVVGPPRRSGRVLDMLKAAHRDGVREVELSPTSVVELRFNADGLYAFARIAHLRVAPFEDLAHAPPDRVYLIRRDPAPGLPKPCTKTVEGWFIYMIRGPTSKPLGPGNAYCPLRS